MRISLKAQISLFVILVAVTVATAISAIYVFDQIAKTKDSENRFLSDTQKDVETLAYIVTPHLLESNYSFMKSLVSHEKKHSFRAYIVITDDKNKVLIDSENENVGNIFKIPTSKIAENNSGELTQRYRKDGKEIIDISHPVNAGDLMIGTVRIGLSTDWLQEEKNKQNQTILKFSIAVIGIILLSVIMAIIIANRIANPILLLKQATEKVGKGEYGQNVPIRRNDEIGLLTVSFNHMVADIKNSREQLLLTQEELVRKEKLSILGQLSGSVGHELRNPLGVISNAVYFLQTIMPDADETVREYLGIIKGEVNNSQRIITDLLDFTRTKTPRTNIVTVAELIKQGLGQCLVPEGISLRVEIPDTLPSVKVDPLQMGQVFQNLITNAVQSMLNVGSLTIRAEEDRESGALSISVADTGEGISTENMKKIFQPLFTTKARGRGLGLTDVKNLIEANGGKIEVDSQTGKGTTFTVILPYERA